MYDPTLRKRFGYLVTTRQPSPLLAMLDLAGFRARPMNRLFPASGHWIIGTCPLCGEEDGAFVHPDGASWSTTCRRGEFGIFELHAALLMGRAA